MLANVIAPNNALYSPLLILWLLVVVPLVIFWLRTHLLFLDSLGRARTQEGENTPAFGTWRSFLVLRKRQDDARLEYLRRIDLVLLLAATVALVLNPVG